ncbi:MAG: ribosome-associated translation inhibitor RaiA [Actinomycetota bacterium]
MELTVHSKDLKVTPALKGFASEKLGHLSRFLPNISSVDVELHEEGHHRTQRGHTAHVTVVAGKRTFRSKVIANDPRACIDLAATRLERNIKEFKRKRQGKPAHSRPKAHLPDITLEDETGEDLD